MSTLAAEAQTVVKYMEFKKHACKLNSFTGPNWMFYNKIMLEYDWQHSNRS
jgi:hypothetical protein